MRRSLLLLLLAAPCAAAVPPEHRKCPNGKEPVFTGAVFKPLYCPPGGKEPQAKAVEPDASQLPEKGSWSSVLEGLDGTWRGLAYFAGTRYEVTVEVQDGGKRGRLDAMDYATHISFPLLGALEKPGWFSRKRPKLRVELEGRPDLTLQGPVELGKAPPQNGKPAPLPRRAVWRFEGRPELHSLDFDVRGASMTAVYTLTTPAFGAVTASADLVRIK